MTVVRVDDAIGRLSNIAEPLHQAVDNAHIWLVGGVVRDALLGRPLPDVDIVTDSDPGDVARQIARQLGGSPFPLSDRHGCWRIAAPTSTDAAWDHVDICRSRGDIDDDLSQRDFTINAIAYRPGAEAMHDPLDGCSDLVAGQLRLASASAIDDDPLRAIRAVRFAHVLELTIDPGVRGAVRNPTDHLHDPSGERIFSELSAIVASRESRRGVRLLDDVGLLEYLLPELYACKGLQQSSYHHLDVFEHTLAVLDNVEDISAEPDHYLPQQPAWDGEYPFTAEESLILRFAALAHDLGKPGTHQLLGDRVSFIGHDVLGVDIVHAMCDRWKTSTAFRTSVAQLVRTHLKLGMLLHGPCDQRARYQYIRETEPVTAAAIVLSMADRFATAGPMDRRRWVRKHMTAAQQLWVDHWIEHCNGRPAPLLDGLEIAAEAGIDPGPALGLLVAALAEEQAVGAVTTQEEARQFIRASAAKH